MFRRDSAHRISDKAEISKIYRTKQPKYKEHGVRLKKDSRAIFGNAYECRRQSSLTASTKLLFSV